MSIIDQIAQGVRPPQIENPLEVQGRLLALQNMRAQQQLLPEQLKGVQMENQQRQIQMDQAKAVNDAYRNAFAVGPDGAPNLDTDKLSSALAAGGHGAAIPSILEGVTKYKQAQVNLQESGQKVALAARDAAGSLGAAVDAAKNDPHLFLTLAQHAVQSHEVDPKIASAWMGPVQQALQADPTGESARQLVGQISANLIALSPKQQELTNQRNTAQGSLLRGQAAQTQATRAQEEAQRKDAAADLATAATPADYAAKLNALPHGLALKFPPAEQAFDSTGKPIPEATQRIRFVGMTPAEQNNAVKPARESNPTEASLAMVATDPSKTPEERAAAEAALKRLDASKVAARPVIQTLVPGLGPGQGGQGQAQLAGDDFLRTLPAATANQIRAIAEGRATLPSASTRSQGALQLRNAVFQFDPDFSEQRAQVRKAFTTGPDGRNIGALNTATVHLDQFGEVAKAMANGSFRPGNAVFNAARSMFGGAMPTNFQGLKTAVAGELAAALKGNATDPEIANISSAIQASNSPEQLAGYVDTQLHVLGAKLNTYQERYRQQMPSDNVWSPVLPSARAVYAKHGIDPTGAGQGAGGPLTSLPQGGGKVIDAVTARKFYEAAGGDPVKARQFALQSGWRVQ